jgi:hypothetical protein
VHSNQPTEQERTAGPSMDSPGHIPAASYVAPGVRRLAAAEENDRQIGEKVSLTDQ